MASTYKHGVYVQETETKLIAPVLGTAGLQVIVGTAPVNMLDDPAAAVNTPLLVYSYQEGVLNVGYSDDFEKYTLCESINANFQVVNTGPLVLINVLDPNKKEHQTDVSEKEITFEDGVATLDETGMLLKGMTLTSSDEEGGTLEAETDYTTTFNNDGTLNFILTESGEEKVTTSNKAKVNGKKLDPSKVTYQDIIGGVDIATGKETGLEVIRQIYPKLGMTPGILVAPRFSMNANVSAALQAKTKEINGVFRAVTVIDIDSTAEGATKYTDVKQQKEKQTVTDPHAYAVWGYGKVGDVVYSGSTLAASLTAYTDAVNDDTPNVSPSNKTINISASCLEDGTEVLLDRDQANTVNSFGVATWLNMSGFRLWGNNTVAYPGTTDPKDRWFSIRRFLNWAGNTFILTYSQRVDSPMNRQLIEAIVDSENVRGNSFVARGICARYQIAYNEDENPTTELLNGHIVFHQYMTPYPPAEHIEDIIEYDPDALATALGG